MSNSIYNGTFVLGDVSATTLSAGNGIKITTDEPGVIKVSNDETVLYSGNYNTNTTAVSLSEPVSNFETFKVMWQHNSTPRLSVFEYGGDSYQVYYIGGRAENAAERVTFEAWWDVNSNSMTKKFCRWNYMSNGKNSLDWSEANEVIPVKILGINRKQNGGN